MLLLTLFACWDAEADVAEHCRLARTTFVTTEDGATIALHRHASSGPPVLLVHGIASNHHFWDLNDHGLAHWLSDRGWDVWLLDLRGHGDALYTEDGARQWAGWSIDDYGQKDVPAAVAWVQAVTGYDTVGYVGHSMGGMVGGIYAQSGGADELSALIAVGSPASFEGDHPLMTFARWGFAAGGTALYWVETPLFASAAVTLGDVNPIRFHERLYNIDNMDPLVVELALRNITSPLSRVEMQQFSRMLREKRFQSFDGKVDYLAGLGAVRTPTLVIAGAKDEVAPLAWVSAYADAVGGDRELFVAGTESGLGHDYGHLDLGLGARADTEIFPRIEAWLERHPPRR